MRQDVLERPVLHPPEPGRPIGGRGDDARAVGREGEVAKPVLVPAKDMQLGPVDGIPDPGREVLGRGADPRSVGRERNAANGEPVSRQG